MAHIRKRSGFGVSLDPGAIFEAMFETVPVAISITRPDDGAWLRMNPALCNMLGYTQRELSLLTWRDLTHPDDLAADAAQYEQILAGKLDSYKLIKRYVHKSGAPIWSRVTISYIDNGLAEPYVLAIAEDITSSVEDAKALQESEERYRSVVDMCPDAILVIADHKIVFGNEAAARLFGAPNVGRLYGVHSNELINPDSFESLSRTIMDSLATGLPTDLCGDHLRRMNGSLIDAEVQVVTVPVTYASTPATQIIVRDVTEERRASARLKHQATHDDLTGLPNRNLLFAALEGSPRRRAGSRCGVLLMDLDRFKDVNDTFGHQYGDQLLRQLGARLQECFEEPKPIIARLGGDEFAIVLHSATEADAAETATRLLGVVRRPFHVSGQRLEINGSVGIALSRRVSVDSNELLRRADVAMYLAKRDRKGFAFYDAERDNHSPARLGLMSELRLAIENNELLLYYQPKCIIRTGEIMAAEALVRWNHPVHGIRSPAEFVPLAEQGGLIFPLTAWVLDDALRQVKSWHDSGRSLEVSVNLSLRNLNDVTLVSTLEKLLEKWSVSPTSLKLELTETAIMDDPQQATQILNRIHDMGIGISIDDFGTGYSSLEYLAKLPVDEIKIDGSFVTDMTSNRDHAFIVRSTVDLGHNLGLQVVAEGVEDQRTCDMLGVLGCDIGQGYFHGRPLPAPDLTGLLTRKRRDPRR